MKAFAITLVVCLGFSAVASGQKSSAPPFTIIGGEPAATKTASPVVPSGTSPAASAQPAPTEHASPTPPPPPRPVNVPPPTRLGQERVRAGAKLFIEPMNGFETYIEGAFLRKKVPVLIVDDRSKADFIMTGISDEAKAGWAKVIFISPASHAQASISVKDARTGNLVFAYNVDKLNAVRANQSTAEACAKHFKEAMEK